MTGNSLSLTLSRHRPSITTPLGGEGAAAVLVARTQEALASKAGIILITKAS
jgi:hypothetical protein